MSTKNPEVDAYFHGPKRWCDELGMLRTIVLRCGLTEELKWGSPCYTDGISNILLLGGLRSCCTLSFLKGVLLQDKNELLIQPGENTQSARYIGFTSVEEIAEMETTLKAYIREAIDVEKACLKVDYKKSSDLTFPDELECKMNEDSSFNSAFKALTPGRQRGYVLFFSAPKQSKTRESRIEKYTQRILDGKGFNDCTCGLSKKMPGCDGSHKFIGCDGTW